MIRKSGSRFSEKIMLKQLSKRRPTAGPKSGNSGNIARVLDPAGANKNPGPLGPGVFRSDRLANQAAGLNSLLALALIGSTVSDATFCESSVSSLLQDEKASNCFLA
jgi:hypothetical protein